jgi:outer membrane receptor protein involved in Fe transport
VALPPTDPAGAIPNPLWTINPLFGAFQIEPYATVARDRDESKFTPLLTAQWDATDAVMLYGTYVTGFKSGGFDARSNAHPDPTVVNALNLSVAPPADIVGVFEYDEEEAVSLEIGSKATAFQGRSEFNVALYRTSYEDLQTSVFDGVLGFNVVNASKATIQGIEFDSRWRATDQLSLSAGFAYLDFEFDEFNRAQCYFNDPRPVTGPGTCDATGDRKEYTPKWTLSLVADYARPFARNLLFNASAELFHSDDYIWSPTLDPVATQSAFTKVDLRVAISSADRRWEVSLIGKNLTDELVSVFGGNAPLAGRLTNGTGNAYYTFVDRPRSVALQATYRFARD